MENWQTIIAADGTAEYIRGEWRITPAVGGGWILCFRGYQLGGDVDRSGAGNRAYPSPEAAAAAAAE